MDAKIGLITGTIFAGVLVAGVIAAPRNNDKVSTVEIVNAAGQVVPPAAAATLDGNVVAYPAGYDCDDDDAYDDDVLEHDDDRHDDDDAFEHDDDRYESDNDDCADDSDRHSDDDDHYAYRDDGHDAKERR